MPHFLLDDTVAQPRDAGLQTINITFSLIYSFGLYMVCLTADVFNHL